MTCSRNNAPPLVLTMGEPAGIGGELTFKAWHKRRKTGPVFVFVGDPTVLAQSVQSQGGAPSLTEVRNLSSVRDVFADGLPVLPLSSRIRGTFAHPAKTDAALVAESIRTAVALCRDGLAGAVVTNPIHKKSLYDAGFRFPGHTEFIANLCGTTHPVMMLQSPRVRVVPLTVHLSLREAINTIDENLICRVVCTVNTALRTNFGLSSPRLAVAGLNPHAGEGGTLGHEDTEIIAPAVERLRGEGINITGPVPGDALFTPENRQTFDVAICMYHDQALIPVKALDFDRAVNVTLGLPIIRTSPDHGTAFDIAGKGIASPSSLIAALDLAAEMSARRQNSPSGP